MSVSTAASVAILPFGVPEGHQGLGGRFATLLWSRAGIAHPAVGLFSAMGRGLEAEVSPGAWPTLWKPFGASDHAPPEPDYVLTGSIEPPLAGVGEYTFRLFRTADLLVVSEERASFSEAHAGDSLGELMARTLRPVSAPEGLLPHSFASSFAELSGMAWDDIACAAVAEVSLAMGQEGALLALERCVCDAPFSVYPAKRLGEVISELARRAGVSERLRLARVLSRAMEASPGRPELLLADASLRWASDDIDGSLNALRLVTALAPNDVTGHQFLGRVLRTRGDWKGARSSLNRALELQPDNAVTPYELARHAVHDEDEAASAGAYAHVMRITSAHDSVLWNELADVAEIKHWPVLASMLVDHVLRQPAVWSSAIHARSERLCLACESEGTARVARLNALADASALVLAQEPPSLMVPSEPKAVVTLWARLRAHISQWRQT